MIYKNYTHQGKREKNEDRILMHEFPSGVKLLGIADGMGGYEAGGEVAVIVLSSILESLENLAQGKITKSNLLTAFEFANRQVRTFRFDELNGKKAGATVAIVVIHADKAICAWSGDCRIRYYENQLLIFESEDHTLANEWKKRGLDSNFSIIEKYKGAVTHAITGELQNWHPSFQLIDNVKSGANFQLLTDGYLEAASRPDVKNSIITESKDNATLISITL